MLKSLWPAPLLAYARGDGSHRGPRPIIHSGLVLSGAHASSHIEAAAAPMKVTVIQPSTWIVRLTV